VTPETDPSSTPSNTSSPQPTPSSAPSSGLRYNAGKLPLELVPPEALVAIAAVLREGAKKYAERNWEGGMNWEICYGCFQRHAQKWQMGLNLDHETKLPHSWHMLTNLAFIVAYELRNLGLDNRPPNAYDGVDVDKFPQPFKEFLQS